MKKDALPVSGFVGSKVTKKQTEALIVGVQSIGSGTAVYLLENPLFRGFWENGKLLLLNAIFMVNWLHKRSNCNNKLNLKFWGFNNFIVYNYLN